MPPHIKKHLDLSAAEVFNLFCAYTGPMLIVTVI